MAYPPAIYRLHNFARAEASGEDLDPSKIDAEHNRYVSTINALVQWVRGITNADGTLKFSSALREMDLIEEVTAVGVAGASQVVTVGAYNLSTDRVRAFQNGVRLDPSEVDLTSTTSVTLTPAGGVATSDKLVVEVFSNGAGALTTLALATAGNGASLIGIEDAGGLIDSVNVEGALAELATDLEDFIDDVGDLDTIVRTDVARTMAVDLTFSASKTIKGLRASVANGEAVRHEQIQAAALLAVLNPTLAAAFLSLTGGTMSGQIDMGGQKVVNAGAGTANTDLVTRAQLDAIQTTVTATLQSPPGMFMDFGGSTVPSGWLYCDGSEVSQATYPNLYAAIGNTWGTAAAGNFKLPDFRGFLKIGDGTGTLDKVCSVTVDAGGAAYSATPTITFTGGGGAVQATARAEVVGGIITDIVLLTRGSGYTSAPTIVITDGTGAGATATASITLTARTLAGVDGEEAHIQTEDEVAKHRHTELSAGTQGTNEWSAGSGSQGQYSTNTGYAGSNSPMNVMPPTKGVKTCIKT